MNPELQKELLARLDTLAAKLGVGAQALWQIYAQQARVEVITDIFLMLFFPAITTILLYVVIKQYHKDEQEGWYSTAWFGGIVGGVVTLGVWISGVQELLQIALNKNYWILQQILSVLKGN